jgi:hypothetical protein
MNNIQAQHLMSTTQAEYEHSTLEQITSTSVDVVWGAK